MFKIQVIYANFNIYKYLGWKIIEMNITIFPPETDGTFCKLLPKSSTGQKPPPHLTPSRFARLFPWWLLMSWSHTLPEKNILLMVQKSCDHQLRSVVFYFPLFAGFFTSQVVKDLFHQQYEQLKKKRDFHWFSNCKKYNLWMKMENCTIRSLSKITVLHTMSNPHH